MTGRLSLEEAARNREIREWAAAHRIPCAARGPIPPNVREAWQQAADGAGRWIETASGPPTSSRRITPASCGTATRGRRTSPDEQAPKTSSRALAGRVRELLHAWPDTRR